MTPLAQSLKYPLLSSTRYLLGGCTFDEDSNVIIDKAKQVTSVALAALSLFSMFISTPLWCLGECIEVLNLRSSFVEDRLQRAESYQENSLDPEKTQYVGVSISTYQNSSDSTFCLNSNWGRYNQIHFSGEKQVLSPGRGLDILTTEDQPLICDLLHKMNANTMRFSMEITDVMDSNGTINEVSMQKYVDAAACLHGNGIKPMVTLSHFVHPLDERKRDIFENKTHLDHFVRFAECCYKFLHPYVDTFFTFNEPNVSSVCNYILGEFPAKGKGLFWKHTRVVRNMLEVHKKVYSRLHELAEEQGKQITVGLTHQALEFIPNSRWNILARIICFLMTDVFHESFMRWAEKNENTLDCLGVQYYTRPLIGGFPLRSMAKVDEEMVESMNFRYDPIGIFYVLQNISRRLQSVPLMVTETGTAGRSDVYPIKDIISTMTTDRKKTKYYHDSIYAVRKAQEEKCKITGYLIWTLVGNFEWAHGFSREHDFGVIARDRYTGEVRITEAFLQISKVFKESISSVEAMRHSA